MSNFFSDNEDLVFQFEHGIPWDEIIPLVEKGFRDPEGHPNIEEAKAFYRDVLSLIGEFVAAEMAPMAEQVEHDGLKLVNGHVDYGPTQRKIHEAFKQMEFFGLSVPRELGGLNCPSIVSYLSVELMSRGDTSSLAHLSFHGAIAIFLLIFSFLEGTTRFEDGLITETRFREAIREIMAGDAWGCMVLTEPEAGSDLSNIRTRAELVDGVWRISGDKIFITEGNGQYHIVLARTSEPVGGREGLNGLSLFLVRRWLEKDGETIENVVVERIEEKIGAHGTATCALRYNNSEGELIGRVGEGFRFMLEMMNTFRLGVGFESLGVMEASYRMAREFAEGRRTMEKPIIEHELIADALINMEADIRGLRLLAYEAMAAVELELLYRFALAEKDKMEEVKRKHYEKRRRQLRKKARRLTPLLKYLAAERAVEVTRMNIQIHGGLGYIRETGAGRLLADALIFPIYEGTSQIQALMVMKDKLKEILRAPSVFLKRAAKARLSAVQSTSQSWRMFHKCEAEMYSSLEHIVLGILRRKFKREWQDKVSKMGISKWPSYLTREFLRKWDPSRDFSLGLLHSERVCRMASYIEVARLLLEQAEEYPERQYWAERYVMRMVPKVMADAMEIKSGDEDGTLEWIDKVRAEREGTAESSDEVATDAA